LHPAHLQGLAGRRSNFRGEFVGRRACEQLLEFGRVLAQAASGGFFPLRITAVTELRGADSGLPFIRNCALGLTPVAPIGSEFLLGQKGFFNKWHEDLLSPDRQWARDGYLVQGAGGEVLDLFQNSVPHIR